jgi:cathepsin F/cysteine peptidase B
MKTFIVAIVLLISIAVAVASTSSLEQQFRDFQRKYNKVYTTTAEFDSRFHIFKFNLQRAKELQAKNPLATFGVTKFSDLTQEEFASFYLMPHADFANFVKPAPKDFSVPHSNNRAGCSPDPKNYDWDADCNACTDIYNQGQCGSCWAFSATETIESYFFLGGQTLTGLAMEQIVDCDTGGQDQGCNGGFPSGAYSYVQSAGGIEALSDYPYTAEGGESGTCAFNKADVVATVTGSSSISGESGLYSQTSSASGGPVSVCVDASSWSSYSGGVLTSCGNNVDHCVQLTGYANYGENGSYWIVRNSWGEDWGESGFIWVEIGQDLCSIGDYATIVTAGTA